MSTVAVYVDVSRILAQEEVLNDPSVDPSLLCNGIQVLFV